MDAPKNLFTLKFEDKELENEFMEYYWGRFVGTIRFYILLGIFLYICFTLLDMYLYPNIQLCLMKIRFLFVVPILLLIYFLLRSKKYLKYLQFLMFILGIVSAFGIIEMIRIIDLHHYEKNIYFSGLLLVGFFTYASFRIRFLWSVALGIITITAYELMVILVNDVDMKYIVASSFFLIPFHVAGIIFSYTLELDSRNYFILMKELMKEKTTLTDLNLKLDKLAHIDGLTKIANKRYLMEKLKYFWFEHKKLKLPLSVIMIDVDFFKNYNDLYGHLEGDKVLQAIAETLQNVIRKDADIVGRFGGEEFLVILTETPSDKAFDVAERVRLKIENLKIPHENSEVSPYVTVSLGVASVIPEDDDFEKIIELADIALYRAKNSGRNKVVENF